MALSLFGLLVMDILVTFVWWADFEPAESGFPSDTSTQERYRIFSGLRIVLTFLGVSIIGAFVYQYTIFPSQEIQLTSLALLSFGLVFLAKIMGRHLFYKWYFRYGI